MTTQPQQPTASSPADLTLETFRRAIVGALTVLVFLFAITAAWPFIRRISASEGWSWIAWGSTMAVATLVALGFLTTRPTPLPGGLELLRKFSGFVLIVLAAGFIALPIYFGIREQGLAAWNPLFYWGATMALACVVLGINFLVPSASGMAANDYFRMLLLLTGAIAGLLTTLLGFVLYGFNYSLLLRGMTGWREKPDAILLATGATLGGMIALFVSVQLARGQERNSSTLRRLLYGGNTLLSVLLLIYVLAIPNVLAYVTPFEEWGFGRSYDWTLTGFNSLSEKSISILKEMPEPVKVVVLLEPGTNDEMFTRSMLEAAKGVSSNIAEWREIDPRNPAFEKEVSQLINEFTLPSPQGILIISTKNSKKSAFIPKSDLSRRPQPMMGREDSESYTYLGENAFISGLASLEEGKVTVYFTQGSGEPGLTRASNSPDDAAKSVEEMSNRLKNNKNIEVKPLKLDPTVRKIPDDAGAVVVIRPARKLPAEAVEAMRTYLRDRDGKLVALLEPVIVTEGGSKSLAETGLEGLLNDHGVELGKERLLSVGLQNPLQVVAFPNPQSTNPIAASLIRGNAQFIETNVRTVTPAAPAPGRQVETLLLGSLETSIIKQPNLNADLAEFIGSLRNDPRKNLLPILLRNEPSLAVTVSDGGGNVPADMAHAGLSNSKPRMVVFGSAGWATDRQLTTTEFGLLSSSISWLRGRTIQGKSTAPEKKVEPYNLNVAPQNYPRLIWLPLVFMLVVVSGLGMGVWMVRRR
jgi:ABC-type uncharacterized transport system